MTPQQLNAMKLALEALELLTGAWQTFDALDYGDNAITAIKEALAEHAMQEVQRLGQEIKQEPTVEQIEAAIEAWFNNFKSTPYQKRMRAALKAANSIKE